MGGLLHRLMRMKCGLSPGSDDSDGTEQDALILCVAMMIQKQNRLRQQRAQTSSSQVPYDEASRKFYEKGKKRLGGRDTQKRNKAGALSLNDEASQKFYEKGKKRPRGRDAQKRKKPEASSINDGCSNIVSYLEQESARKMAKHDESAKVFRTLVKVKEKELDPKILPVDIETLPEWKRGPMIAMQKGFSQT